MNIQPLKYIGAAEQAALKPQKKNNTLYSIAVKGMFLVLFKQNDCFFVVLAFFKASDK